MNRTARPFLLALLLLLSPATAQERPNVVFILADDMGIDSVSAFNPRCGVATPNIDRLAREGMSFMDAHSGSGVCSPTRYGVLTGRYSWRTRKKRGIVNKWEGPLISAERLTVGKMLQQAGYHTACVGKWHLGWDWHDASGAVTRKLEQIDFTRPLGGGPLTRGFHEYFGDDVPNWPPYAWIEGDRLQSDPTGTMKADRPNGVSPGPMTPGWRLDAVLPAITNRAVRYIGERAASARPFFLFFSLTSPHTPINPSPRFLGRSGVSAYADLLMETDWAVGEVMRALKRHGLEQNTLLFFTADNGTSPKCDYPGLEAAGVHLREHWRGMKADIFEGGHRVPFIVRRPGRIAKRTRNHVPICLTDFMRTAASATGCDVPADAAEDSVDLMPLLRGAPPSRNLRAVVHHSSNGFFAVRSGRWKAVFCRGSGGWSAPKEAAARRQGLPEVQLYDMSRDPRERNNLAAAHPEVVEGLRALLREYVENGRSTPGPKLPVTGRTWWPRLPWKGP